MKKTYIIVVVLLLVSSFLFAGDKKISMSGRVLMEMVKENNTSDFTAYDEENPSGTNDSQLYGDGRVDLKFKATINKIVTAYVSTRFEGKGSGDKWMNFGSDESGEGDQLKDAWPALQEAYVNIDNLFNSPLNMKMGRQGIGYGAGNIIDDKFDGLTLNLDMEKFYANLHFLIIDAYGNFETAEGDHNLTALSLNGGMNGVADMMDINAYFWRTAETVLDNEDSSETVTNAVNVIGARAEAGLMDGLLSPYFEFAIQSGGNGQGEEISYSGMLLDIGTDLEKDLGSMTIDAMFEFFMASGDDMETNDEYEHFGLIDLSGREEGWFDQEVALEGNQMIKFGLGMTPASLEAFHAGLTFWMFNDNSSNYENEAGEEISGENMYNELGIDASYKITKKTKLYGGLSYIMPNEDYPGYGEDAGTAMYFGTQVKW